MFFGSGIPSGSIIGFSSTFEATSCDNFTGLIGRELLWEGATFLDLVSDMTGAGFVVRGATSKVCSGFAIRLLIWVLRMA